MRVSTILATKGASVATIDPQTSVADVVDELRLRGVGALVVSRDGLTVEGVVTERDVVRRLSERGDRVLRDKVTDLMEVDGPTCGPGDTVVEVMAVMTELRVRHVPVTVDGMLAGIVSIGDVVKARLSELEADAQHLVDYLVTGR
jgi:CBS domain-containing protein